MDGASEARGIGRALAVLVFVAACAMLLRPAALTAGSPRLVYVAIVMRHGVRSPTWTLDRLEQWSAEPWPSFGVAPGELTPHGRALVALLGAYYREWLSREQLLEPGCVSATRTYIWADRGQRTLETGRALAESLFPSCAPAVHTYEGSGADPLFDPISAGAVHPNLRAIATDVRARLGSDPAEFVGDLQPALNELQHMLTGDGRAAEMLATQGDVRVDAGPNAVELAGPLSPASTLSEVFELEYANGFSGNVLGWGRLDESSLFRILSLHRVYADLARRTPAMARARGSNLLAHLTASLEQAVSQRDVAGALGRRGDVLLVVSGHDTNLSNLSGMLDLSWRLPGYQPDDTPPGGALVFTVWRDPAVGDPFVRLQYLAATLGQMHDATPLTIRRPPAIVDLPLPACRDAAVSAGCPWPAFSRAVRAAIDPSVVVHDPGPVP